MCRYLILICIHKWYVFIVGRKLGLWLFWHDLSKFMPVELFPYFRWFNNTGHEVEFLEAVNHHHKWNKHHWEYWVVPGRGPLVMPDRYIKEMVADWAGSGKSYNGFYDLKNWYENNKNNITLHCETRMKVEGYIRYLEVVLSK